MILHCVTGFLMAAALTAGFPPLVCLLVPPFLVYGGAGVVGFVRAYNSASRGD